MKTNSTTLYIVRHGETEWNKAGRNQGHLDSPLTELGVAQAKTTGLRLQREELALIYASDLGRAHTTAQHIAEATGCPLLLEPRLREKHLGLGQGLTGAEFAQQYPAEQAAFLADPIDYASTGGESTRQLYDRAVTVFTDLAQQHPGERIVAVTHGGMVSVFVRYVLGLPFNVPRRYQLPNTAINIFEYHAEEGEVAWRVKTLGDVGHLPR